MPKIDNEINTKIIGDRILELRKSKNLKQEDLMKTIGVSRVTMVGYEKGTVVPPTSALIKIAETYHVSIDWICGLSEQKEQKHHMKIETMTDFIELLPYLSSLGEITEKEDEDEFYAEITFKGLLYEAIVNYNQIYALFRSQTISKDVFDLCIRGLCDKYKDYPLKFSLNSMAFIEYIDQDLGINTDKFHNGDAEAMYKEYIKNKPDKNSNDNNKQD